MTAENMARLHQAVDECLIACESDPTAARMIVAEFCHNLEESGWPAGEIDYVRSMVTREIDDRERGYYQ